MHYKMIISLVVTVIYLFLMGYVIANLWRLKKASTWYKTFIGLASVIFAPGGFAWYLIERRKDNRKNKK